MKLGILSSGNLGKDTLEKIILNFNVVFVLTDSNSQGILSLCKKNKIPYFKGNPRNGIGYDFMKKIEVDIIVSINYLFLIEKDIIQHSKQLSFNIHGSLLPKYRGRTPHVWSIINNEKVTGITAHVIDEGCDTGDIISQIKIPINKIETGAEILNKFKLEYYNLILGVFKKLNSGKLELIKQDEQLATYFGKRTPADGQINWDWQSERIRNWVRAQSYPYPGAFTFFKGEKIIIDEVKVSDFGFKDQIVNGTVLSTNKNIVVKTSNKALELTKLRNPVKIKVGEILE
ncbi:methionyl-tRNA formyltransferase [Aurantibacter sp.]|uniref:methionyl-tRNA formyltransferase n=1 Tax=Aurantibacter sp. TaxID=2807103 RepID=UPI0035C86CEC